MMSFKHPLGASNVPIISPAWDNEAVDPWDDGIEDASFCTFFPVIRYNGAIKNVMFLGMMSEPNAIIVIDALKVVVGEKSKIQKYMNYRKRRASSMFFGRKKLC